MRHREAYRKLGRSTEHRWAMLRTMVSQLVQHERIETTLPKAKELRMLADKMVTLGKEGTLSAMRRAAGILRTDETLHKVFYKLAPRYADRFGGYTRVVQTRRRMGDASTMAFIEFVDRPGELRPARPPVTPPPQKAPMEPWAASKLKRITVPPGLSRSQRPEWDVQHEIKKKVRSRRPRKSDKRKAAKEAQTAKASSASSSSEQAAPSSASASSSSPAAGSNPDN